MTTPPHPPSDGPPKRSGRPWRPRCRASRWRCCPRSTPATPSSMRRFRGSPDGRTPSRAAAAGGRAADRRARPPGPPVAKPARRQPDLFPGPAAGAHRLVGLSLVAGVSVADSLEPLSASPRAASLAGLKWPSDLWLSTPEGESKLAGILVEDRQLGRPALCGHRHRHQHPRVALDAAQAPAAPRPPSRPAACRRCCRPRCAGRAAARDPAAGASRAGVERFGFAPFQARFAARDVLAGRAVQLSDGTTGAAHGARRKRRAAGAALRLA